jgi:hypothetical protein
VTRTGWYRLDRAADTAIADTAIADTAIADVVGTSRASAHTSAHANSGAGTNTFELRGEA